MEVYVVGKQWMWKFQHPSGQREINELHVPVGQPVKLMMTSRGRDPQLLRPGVPRQAGRRCPGRYTTIWFEADQAGHVPPVLRRVLRHEPLGDDRLGRRDGAGRVPDLARRRQPDGSLADQGLQAVQRARLRHLPQAETPAAAARRSTGVFGSQVDAGRRRER